MSKHNEGVTLTDCFQYHLKSLQLNQYPCHEKRSKRSPNTKGSSKQISRVINQNEKDAEQSEIEALTQLIKDKNSPWYEIIEWTNDGDNIREQFIKDSSRFDLDWIEQYFTCLKFRNENLSDIDEGLKKFKNLELLIISCNRLFEIDGRYLPSTLTCKFFSDLSKLNPKVRIGVQHLGMAYNWVNNINNCFHTNYWYNLVSMDISYNQIVDLAELVEDLANLKRLKLLMLYGNPIVLLPGYRGYVIDSFPNLFALDDRQIRKEEKINFLDFKYHPDFICQNAEINVYINHIKNLIIPEQPEFDDEPEIFFFKYLVRFEMIDDGKSKRESTYYGHEYLHSMIRFL